MKCALRMVSSRSPLIINEESAKTRCAANLLESAYSREPRKSLRPDLTEPQSGTGRRHEQKRGKCAASASITGATLEAAQKLWRQRSRPARKAGLNDKHGGKTGFATMMSASDRRHLAWVHRRAMSMRPLGSCRGRAWQIKELQQARTMSMSGK